MRRPLLLGGIAAAALLVLGAPALGMRIGNPSIDLPSNLGVVRVLADIQHEFPGKPAPADVVVSGSEPAKPGDADRARSAADGRGRGAARSTGR